MTNIKNKLLSLTPSAIKHLKSILEDSPETNMAVKLGVKNGGCAGMAYTMDYIDEVRDTDECIEIDGIKLVIDPKAILFLLGTEMDYQKSTLNSGFIFNNPNQTDACGCGESVTLVEADIPVDFNKEGSIFPLNFASLFSRKALTPSLKSSDWPAINCRSLSKLSCSSYELSKLSQKAFLIRPSDIGPIASSLASVIVSFSKSLSS